MTDKKELIEKFEAWEEKLYAYQFALNIIGIDSVAAPPIKGMALRNKRTAYLAGERFAVQNDPDNYEVMTQLLKEEDLDPVLRRRVQMHHKQASQLHNVPRKQFEEYNRILAESEQAWLKYKPLNDWQSYAPYLEKLVDAFKALYECRNDERDLYDQMLDDNQEGWDHVKYDAFFNAVKERLVPLIAKVKEAEQIDDSCIKGEFDVDAQRKYMRSILEYVGFTSDWGKISESEHPLTSGVSAGDIRFTTKYRPYNGVQAVISSIHESGHAWCSHNVDPAYDGTILTHFSAGLQESQSRLCENHLGKSRSFWKYNYPGLQQAFPEQMGNVDFETFYRALCKAEPSMVRTEADELTYPLHIVIRYEIEKMLFDGSVKVSELNTVWNRMYREYLGVDVTDDTHGILQDMHWPYAYFGYFPTYALGSAFAAQFYHAMTKEINPDELMETNRYPEIMAWLGRNIHHYGAMQTADEIVKLCTGEEFDVNYYLDYLEEKYTALYHLK